MNPLAPGIRPKARPIRIVSEAVAGVVQRPMRSVLTALGTVLGISAFVAVLGITSTANAQIAQQFDALTATQLVVETVATEDVPRTGFPDQAEERVRKIIGVTATGISWGVSADLTSTLPPGIAPDKAEQVRVVAVTPTYWEVADPTLLAGRTFDEFTGKHPVAVLGQQIAERLGITDIDSERSIFIDGRAFEVIGIVSKSKRVTAPMTAILIPAEVASADFGDPGTSATMTVTTELGAAKVVAQQLPVAIDPTNPGAFIAHPPADSDALKNTVSADLRSLFLALAAISLLIGAVGIANSSLISVIERTPEIGLRRAMGALPRHIAAQFLTESAILGGMGGMVGGCLGVVSVIAVAALQQWTPTISIWTVIAAPAIGAIVGLLAGLYPSSRAARIEPIEAFRHR